MRYISVLFITAILILSSSCGHRPRGRHMMTADDSLRAAAAAATRARLAELGKMREEFIGPEDPGTGTGEVTTGDHIRTDILDDTTTSIISSMDRLTTKLSKAEQDSTTSYGVLMSRFSVPDAQHRYMAATYSSTGQLLNFHSEVTKDDKHEMDYDLYFDKGKLRFIHERHVYPQGEEQPDRLNDDGYYMSGATLLYSYRDDGSPQPEGGHKNLMHVERYSLHGDVKGHVAAVFAKFKKEYEVLLTQPLELMVYTPPVKEAMPEIEGDKKVPTRGGRPSF